jgi:hypothetical protein
MTTRRTRDLKRRVLSLAGPNAKLSITHSGGNHLRVTLKRGDHRFVFFFALTPSDRRGQYAETAFIKRKLRSEGRTL